ncbi:MAG: L-aspartate oxidase [Phycisphaeraceae bacterium]|nr:L-aspartate oxidase [Phycisphaeraceae bacterium]
MAAELFDSRRYLIPFRSSLLPQIFCDTLVIGSGVAGLRAAISAAEHGEVIVLCKDEPQNSNTAWAQGGIACVWSPDDTADAHVADTLTAGAGLCDAPIVRRVVRDGPARIAELLDWGMRFDHGPDGVPVLGREGGHGLARILHAGGDATGRELQRCLWQRAAKAQGVRLFTRCQALDLITPGSEPGSPVMGAITHHPRYGLQMIWAKATILATGGAGVVYRETTNPRTATGDGIAMAYRAGASIADMAFVQFHPTCLYLAGAPRSLITEAIRGQGAHLLDHDGHRFMLDEHPLAELAPRDVVTRAIIRRLAARGGTNVLLDCRHIPDFAARFPGIAALLARFDLDAARDPIPVHPAAHYTIGGVMTDDHGRTDAPGLYAVGECACSGLHGANRLASNSLLEGLVLGELAGRAARERTHPGEAAPANGNGKAPAGWFAPARPAPIPIVSDIRPSEHGELDLSDVESSLRAAMWRNAGIERTGARLRDADDMIGFWARYTMDKIFDDTRGWQIQNMLLVAWLIARSAAWRTESRGCHWRTDHPAPDQAMAVHDCWRRGRTACEARPVRADDPSLRAAPDRPLERA